jgi:hypothetical protein
MDEQEEIDWIAIAREVEEFEEAERQQGSGDDNSAVTYI